MKLHTRKTDRMTDWVRWEEIREKWREVGVRERTNRGLEEEKERTEGNERKKGGWNFRAYV